MNTLYYEKFSLIGTISGWRWVSNDGKKISRIFHSMMECISSARYFFN